MPITADIEGVGLVEFPDDASLDEITKAGQSLLDAKTPPKSAFGKAALGGWQRFAGGLTKGVAALAENTPPSMGDFPTADEVQRQSDWLEQRRAMSPSQKLEQLRASPIYQAGQVAEEAAPVLTPAERKSKVTQAGELIGGVAPMALGPAAIPAFGLEAVGRSLTDDYAKIKSVNPGISEDKAADMALDRAWSKGAITTGLFWAVPKILRGPLEKYLVAKMGPSGFAQWVGGRAAAGIEGGTTLGSLNVGEHAVDREGLDSGTVKQTAAGILMGMLLMPWHRGGGTPPTPVERPSLQQNLDASLEQDRRAAAGPSLDDLMDLQGGMTRNQIVRPAPTPPASATAPEPPSPVEPPAQPSAGIAEPATEPTTAESATLVERPLKEEIDRVVRNRLNQAMLDYSIGKDAAKRAQDEQWRADLETELRNEPKPAIQPKPEPPRPSGSQFRPEVPATEPEPGRDETVLDTIRKNNARTVREIQHLFPQAQLNREAARQLRDQAWPQQRIVEPPRPEPPPEEPPAPEPPPSEPPPPPTPVQPSKVAENAFPEAPAASRETATPAAPEPPPVDKWDDLYDTLAFDAEAFAPARHTGIRNYDLDDTISGFVDFAKSRPDSPLAESFAQFRNQSTASATNLKRLRQVLQQNGHLPSKPKAAVAVEEHADLQSALDAEMGQTEAEPLPEHRQAPEAPQTPAPAPKAIEQAANKVESHIDEVAATQGQRPAKEVKAELVSRLEAAIAEAPSESDSAITVQEQLQVAKKGVQLGNRNYPSGKRGDQQRAKDVAIEKERINKLATDAGFKQITISIPGDGDFTIWNTKETLQQVLDAAKRINTKQSARHEIPKSRTDAAERLRRDAADALTVYGDAGNAYRKLSRQLVRAEDLGLDPEQQKRISKLVEALRGTIEVPWRKAQGSARIAQDALDQAESRLRPDDPKLKPLRDAVEQADQAVARERGRVDEAIKIKPIEERGPQGGNVSTLGFFDPAAYKPAIEWGRDLYRRVKDFAQWSTQMLRQFGEHVRDKLRDIYDFIRQGFETARADRPAEAARDTSGDLSINPITRMASDVRETFRQAVDSAPEDLQRLLRWATTRHQAVADTYRRRAERGEIAVGRDRSSNVPSVVANAVENQINHQLNRDFGTRAQMVPYEKEHRRREALTPMREARGGEVSDTDARNELRRQLNVLQTALPTQRGTLARQNRHYQRAIEEALANFNQLKPASELYRRATDAEIAYENSRGVPTLHWGQSGYVFRATDVAESFGSNPTGAGSGTKTPFRRVREHATVADKLAAGEVVQSFDALDNLRQRVRMGQRLIEDRLWVEGMRGMADPLTHTPIVDKTFTVTRADGSTYQQAPHGYTPYSIGDQTVALHEGYQGLLNSITKPSVFAENAGLRTLMQGVHAAKRFSLLMDTYHLGRLAFWNAMTRAGSPKYQRALTVLDNSVAEINRMASRGEIPAEWRNQIVADKQILNLALEQGANLGVIGDNVYAEWSHRIPGLGNFNKWLFDAYQRGAMSQVIISEFKRVRQANPSRPAEDIAREVSRDVNTRFGNLRSQAWIKSKTLQDLARVFFLAPQWNESLLRSEMGAARQALRGLRTGQVGTLAKGLGTALVMQFLGAQLINYGTRGKPTWENEEGEDKGAAGWAGAKISGYVPDYVGGGPGFFFNPSALPVEILHQIAKGAERHGGDVLDSLGDFLRGRESPIGRGVHTLVTGETWRGEKAKTGVGRLGLAAKEALPAPISGAAGWHLLQQMVSNENKEGFPGEFQGRLTQATGMKLEGAPGPEKRVMDLAKRFKRAQGIKEKEGWEPGVYAPLTAAVRRGNLSDADKVLDEILGSVNENTGRKYGIKDVKEHYENWAKHTYTGSKRMENAFYGSLSEAQKGVYRKAREDRGAVASKTLELLAKRLPH